MVLPTVLCIGAQKAGTSWLHENLKWNRGAWLPPFKELHFFDHKFLPSHRPWIKSHLSRGLREATARAQAMGNSTELSYLNTLAEPPLMTRNWYRRVFLPCSSSKVGIDVTPEYASIPEEGVAFVKDFLGSELRLIYLIREPVDRAMSQIRMNIGRRKIAPETPTDWNKLLSEPDLFDRGNYASHIPRWESAFTKNSFLYIPFGSISRRPLDVLRNVEAFCGLPAAHYPRAMEAVFSGPTVQFPEYVVDRLRNMLSEQTRFLESRFGSDFFL